MPCRPLAAIAVFALLSSVFRAAVPDAKPWSGILRDDHRQPIVGAVVRLRSTGHTEATTTADDGAFTFAALPPAEYSIVVEYHGVTATSPQPMQLPRDAETILELSATHTVTLLDEAPTREATGGQKLSAKAVSELPLNKRDFSQLLLLAAGTMTDTNGAANFTQQFAVNGQRGTAAVFAMDGADSSDPEMGGATFTNFNVDAVAEIRSSSGWMPAEIGRGASGYTDIVTRSGTNDIHGSVFEFLRNAALDARNFFDARSIAQPVRIPPFIRNEFGLTNGGPVVIPGLYNGRNRTFYFAEYQGFRQVLSDTEVIPVPTAAERSGLDTTAYPGDTLIVPVDPHIAAILARYPMPNDPSGPYGARTFATSSKVTTVEDQFSVRIDHQISDKSRLFGRFTMANVTGPTTNPSQTALDPEFAVGFLDHQRNGAIAYTRAPSPTFTMESGISFTRTTPSFPTLDRTDPALSFGDGSYEAFNAAAGSVMAAYGNLFQIRQNFQWIRGRHTVKAGGEVRGNRDTTVFGISPNGAYQFGGGTAYATVPIRSASGMHDIGIGDPLPDALTGLLSASAFTYSEAVAPPMFAQGASIGDSAIHRDAYNFYFQDAWKVSDRLTLNYGLRYEIESRIREEDDRTSAPILGLGNPGQQPRLATARLDAADQSQPRLQTRSRRLGAAPVARLARGFAYHRSRRGSHHHAAGQPVAGQLADRQHAVRRVSALHRRARRAHPIRHSITPQQLPAVYTTGGAPVFASGNSKQVPPNTVMDVLRFEQDLAAVSPGHQITPLTVAGISPGFQNGYIATWTAGLEQKLGGVNLNAGYVGTAGIKLPAMDFPNGFSGADPAFAPYTQFDSSGQITGGYGPVNVMTNRSHSSYHALQVSAQQNLTCLGPRLPGQLHIFEID